MGDTSKSNYCTEADEAYAQYLQFAGAEEAYQFGLKIQEVVRSKDLEGLVNLFDNELNKGPRKVDLIGKNFLAVFGDSWSSPVLSDEPDCRPVGWRGWTLGPGLVWYQHSATRGWHIFAVNSWIPQVERPPSAWEIEGKVIHPDCFYVEWWSSDNYEELLEGTNCSVRDIGICLERPGGLSLSKKAYGESIATDPVACTERMELEAPANNGVSAKRSTGGFTEYAVQRTIPIDICERIAPHLDQECEDIRLVAIHQNGGGSYTAAYANIYGVFSRRGMKEKLLVPLANFGSVNHALNFVDSLAGE